MEYRNKDDIMREIAENNALAARMAADYNAKKNKITFGQAACLFISVVLGGYLLNYVAHAIDKTKAEYKNPKTIESKVIPQGSKDVKMTFVNVYDDLCLKGNHK
jgi:ankyrin repeat protein